MINELKVVDEGIKRGSWRGEAYDYTSSETAHVSLRVLKQRREMFTSSDHVLHGDENDTTGRCGSGNGVVNPQGRKLWIIYRVVMVPGMEMTVKDIILDMEMTDKKSILRMVMNVKEIILDMEMTVKEIILSQRGNKRNRGGCSTCPLPTSSQLFTHHTHPATHFQLHINSCFFSSSCQLCHVCCVVIKSVVMSRRGWCCVEGGAAPPGASPLLVTCEHGQPTALVHG